MIIFTHCSSCGTRFRVDARAFKGFRAMRARCRKCGALIEVRNPVMSSARTGDEGRKPVPAPGPTGPLETSPAVDNAAPGEKPVPPSVEGPVRERDIRPDPFLPPDPGSAGREKRAENPETLFDKTNSWHEEGIGGRPAPRHPPPQHRKTKTRSHGYGYPNASNYVLVYAVLLAAGCGAYLLFRIFVSYLN